MKHDLRKEESAFPALPERASEGENASKPFETTPAAAPNSRLAELASRYEPEVFELVRNALDEGQPESAITATLKSNDFTSDEAREIVGAVVEDRRRSSNAAPSTELPAEGDLSDAQILRFVNSPSTAGWTEQELVQGLVRPGLSRRVARGAVRGVAAINLSKRYAGRAIRLAVAHCDDKPDEVVRLLNQQGLSRDEARRLVRDVAAMRTELDEGKQDLKFGNILVVVAVLVSIVTLGLGALVMFRVYFWGGHLSNRGKERVERAERLLDPAR